MNESRQQQMLAGQSSIAQKVFGHERMSTADLITALNNKS